MIYLVQKLAVSPAYLRNDNNEYLHYTDDWYILDSKPDKYVVIYYRGNNDAWKGYGGATVYTRCALSIPCRARDNASSPALHVEAQVKRLAELPKIYA